jgi:hypothetical protein
LIGRGSVSGEGRQGDILVYPVTDVSPRNTKHARFKTEKGQVNIALGQGEALKRFNDAIIEFKFIKKL